MFPLTHLNSQNFLEKLFCTYRINLEFRSHGSFLQRGFTHLPLTKPCTSTSVEYKIM